MAKYTTTQKKEAQAKLASLAAPKPYVSAYQGKIDSLINDINNRKPFSYDFNADPVYHQYRERFEDQGKMAMHDTIAASAAMTGGYGNSYGATAGSLAYQQYLKGLNDIVPSLQDSAYNKYTNDTNNMYNRLSMMQTEEDRAYNRYQQNLKNYYDELAYWSSIANSGGGGGGGSRSASNNNMYGVAVDALRSQIVGTNSNLTQNQVGKLIDKAYANLASNEQTQSSLQGLKYAAQDAWLEQQARLKKNNKD